MQRRQDEEKEVNRRLNNIHSKHFLTQQMKDKERLREEARAEYLRDKQLVDDVVSKIIQEDVESLREKERKKQIARSYMDQAYTEKEILKQRKLEEERLQKERERQYFEELAKREEELSKIKAAKQEEKDKIFEKLSQEQKRKQEEKEYWEYVRNELHVEEMNRKEKIKELMEQEKRQR